MQPCQQYELHKIETIQTKNKTSNWRQAKQFVF